jgi:hypothetical protein
LNALITEQLTKAYSGVLNDIHACIELRTPARMRAVRHDVLHFSARVVVTFSGSIS